MKKKSVPSSPKLSETVIANHTRFLAYLTSRVDSKETAEEILQATYIKGLKSEYSIRDNEKITAWFFRLLKNALTDYYRHKAAEKRALEGFISESKREQAQINQELEKNVCQCVNHVIKTLKPEYADVLQKAEIEDQSVKDLAKEAGTTPTNVSVRLHRARASLKKIVLQTCGACAYHGCLNCTCKH